MRWRGVPPEYRDWIAQKGEGWTTTLVFDGFTSQPIPLHRGIQFYNADLIDSYDPKDGETVVAFVDDMLMLAWARTLAEANNKLRDMMECLNGRLEWSCNQFCEFALDKFGVMGLTRKREPNPGGRPCTRPVQRFPIPVEGEDIPVINTHKFLGVVLDQELRWKDQVNYAHKKGTKWIVQYCRLAKLMKGVSAKFMRHFYISIVVLKMLYSDDLFLILKSRHTKGTKGSISKLAYVQRQASLHITGALKSAPTDAIDACADLFPFHLLVEIVTHKAATRLATLPDSHLLNKHVKKVVGRYVK